MSVSSRVTLLVALEDIYLDEHYERPTGLCFELLRLRLHFNFESLVSCAVRFPEFGIASW